MAAIPTMKEIKLLLRFPVDGLEVPQVVVVLWVDISVVFGVVASHPPELLEPAQCGVDRTGLVGLIL